jgi:hypothetical protein
VNSLKSALETEDHVLIAEHIYMISVVPHQGRSTHESACCSKGNILTATLKEIQQTRAEHLQWHAKNRHKNILFTDENIFTIEEQYNCRNNKIYAQTSCEVKENNLRVQIGHHPFYIMVWWGVSHQGVISLHFCTKGVKLVSECIKRMCYKEL